MVNLGEIVGKDEGVFIDTLTRLGSASFSYIGIIALSASPRAYHQTAHPDTQNKERDIYSFVQPTFIEV